jgi:dTDP-4-amino-4,6-dideoxygalactose transaminase
MIPFLDLTAQYRTIGPDIEAAVLETLRGGNYVLGEPVTRFERDFATYCGTTHAVALNTGTSALHLALLAAGVGPGDEVLTVPMTFVATVAAILYAGARPVFVDIDPETWTMDPAGLAKALTPRTKAVLPVHLHGRLADMEAINAFARAHGLVVIEDAAQAHGAERHGIRAGAFGDIGCFSFYPGKNLGACGEGGAITTSNPAFAEAVRSLRDWGQAGRYNHVRHGFNYRMDAVQGAVLGVKLAHLDRWNAARRAISNRYDEGLDPAIARAAGPFGADHVAHVYAIRVAGRDALRAELEQAGIATGIHYPRPVHLQPAYAGLGHGPGDFPVSEALAAETLSLPLYPELAPADQDRIIATVNALSVTAPAKVA